MSPQESIEAVFARSGVEGRAAIALSGGLDSMVLLDAAALVSRECANVLLEAIHVHHGLSKNADAWAAFCVHECQRRDVPLTIRHVKVDRAHAAGQGLEAAARHARYRAFAECGARFVLAAQHADDQAETVLHQLLRGTGWAGLAGMGEARELAPNVTLVRPFLGLTRVGLEDYAHEHRLEWVEDESNRDTTYARNFLRQQVTPLIAEKFPHYRASLSRAARHAAETDGLLEALATIDLEWARGVAHAERLDALPMERQVNALYHWLRWNSVAMPSRMQLEEWARQLFRATPTDRPHQAGGHDFLIVRKRGVLTLVKAQPIG